MNLEGNNKVNLLNSELAIAYRKKTLPTQLFLLDRGIFLFRFFGFLFRIYFFCIIYRIKGYDSPDSLYYLLFIGKTYIF